MKQCPDNQTNASFIDISRNKWLFFFIAVVFLPHNKNRWQAPKHRPLINPHPVEQIYQRDIKDNGYKSVFTNSWLVHQRNRSWINGLGKNPQKSELIHWRQCLLSGATEPCPLRETLACIHVIPQQCHGHVCRNVTAPSKTHKKWNAVLRRPPLGGWSKSCGFKQIKLVNAC